VGQGYFRQALIERWNGCALTGYKDPTLLIASHIKPWSACTNRHERLSPDNGLLLTPNLDLLFDKGIITFDENNHYEVVFSKEFNITAQNMLHVHRGMRLRGHAYEGMKPFMRYHREHVFLG
jgi:predicted restriction endonuclease